MSARISKDFSFQAALHFEDTFVLNHYDLELYMEVATEDIYAQNIAMDRIKYLFDGCLDSCLFIGANNTKAIEAYSKSGIRICELPDEPFDQIVAAVLISKINAITEKNLFLNELKIRSRICDDVAFFLAYDEEADFQKCHGVWWTDNSPNIFSLTKKTKREKVVELKKDPKDWSSLGLGWKDHHKKDKGEIVFIPVDK